MYSTLIIFTLVPLCFSLTTHSTVNTLTGKESSRAQTVSLFNELTVDTTTTENSTIYPTSIEPTPQFNVSTTTDPPKTPIQTIPASPNVTVIEISTTKKVTLVPEVTMELQAAPLVKNETLPLPCVCPINNTLTPTTNTEPKQTSPILTEVTLPIEYITNITEVMKEVINESDDNQTRNLESIEGHVSLWVTITCVFIAVIVAFPIAYRQYKKVKMQRNQTEYVNLFNPSDSGSYV